MATTVPHTHRQPPRRAQDPRLLAVALACWLTPAQPVSAAEVYRWVDADGVVQFSDRKPQTPLPGQVEAHKLRGVTPDPTPAGSTAPAEDSAAATQPDAAGPTPEQLAAREKVRAQNCRTARQNLELLSGRFRLKGDDGQYLDDAGRTASTRQARKDIADNC